MKLTHGLLALIALILIVIAIAVISGMPDEPETDTNSPFREYDQAIADYRCSEYDECE